jgi:hypothetical protein
MLIFVIHFPGMVFMSSKVYKYYLKKGWSHHANFSEAGRYFCVRIFITGMCFAESHRDRYVVSCSGISPGWNNSRDGRRCGG